MVWAAVTITVVAWTRPSGWVSFTLCEPTVTLGKVGALPTNAPSTFTRMRAAGSPPTPMTPRSTVETEADDEGAGAEPIGDGAVVLEVGDDS